MVQADKNSKNGLLVQVLDAAKAAYEVSNLGGPCVVNVTGYDTVCSNGR